ncbi:hypothetical protein [Stratiformator vulcanicus]|uniref:Uncharacterized protein n=1 Tax=Stratiformator vulcanicus TaxID=2527980 RepID=A0A517QXT3_9PLAN|nr:hypothetical protein [Stratiformator vulcanicus]QDT36413.1 hypothetical protein Pan189_07690 [Stratiformator vulcanicus]
MDRSFLPIALLLCLWGSGCALFDKETVSNPVFVPCGNSEVAWERTVDAIHDFRFPVARENKLDGVIETEYRIGSGLLEPWNKDSVGFTNRLESTLQSIRRKAIVTVAPTQGGYLVGVESIKELEDVRPVGRSTVGGETFQTRQELRRDLDLVDDTTVPRGWIYQGRDFALEQAMLQRVRKRFGR